MKLRLKGNSIRIRLDRRDIERLIRQGRVEDAVQFGPDLSLSYAVVSGPAAHERPEASYAEGRLTIRIDPGDAKEWISSDRLGFDHRQPVEGGVVRVLLEKDLACTERPSEEAADDAYALSNPAVSC